MIGKRIALQGARPSGLLGPLAARFPNYQTAAGDETPRPCGPRA